MNHSEPWRWAIRASELIALGIACIAQPALGATVVFNNRVFGEVVTPIYGPEPGGITLELQGNGPGGTPPGSVIYTGSLLSGAGYTAELWAGSEGTPEAGLLPVAGASTVFRTDRPGFIEPTPSVASLQDIATGERAVLQLRVWENTRANSWSEVMAHPTVLRGVSLPFLSLPLGGPNPSGPDSFPPSMVGLTSFNVHAVPEPGAVGTAVLLVGYSFWRYRHKVAAALACSK